jgi:serine-type D-Ala-D-Ala carboxypeptidase (penicillin-binding protein 5/6)
MHFSNVGGKTIRPGVRKSSLFLSILESSSLQAAILARTALALLLILPLLASPMTQHVAAQTAASQQNGDFVSKAKNAYLMDADSGAVLYQLNGDEAVPPASMSKLMTLAVLFKTLKAGNLRLTDEFVVSESAWRRGGAPSGTSAMMVPVNTKVKLEELLLGIIIQSGNDACIAVAEGLAGTEDAFAKMMNEEGARLGLKKSTFRNSTGLYHPEHLMSVRDLGVLARHIIRNHPEYHAIFAQKEFTYRKHRFINRNPLLFLNIGADGMKTGFIKESGYSMVATARQGERKLIAVITGMQSANDRRDEAKRMLEWGFRAFTEVKLFDAGEKVADARVWGGDRFYIPVVGNGDVIIVLPKFPANQKLKADIVYNYPLKPPIRKGDPIAKLRVTSSSNAVNEIQLFAGEDVEPSGLMRRGLDTLAHQALRFIP